MTLHDRRASVLIENLWNNANGQPTHSRPETCPRAWVGLGLRDAEEGAGHKMTRKKSTKWEGGSNGG